MAGYGFVNGRIQEVEDPMEREISAGAKRIAKRNAAANVVLKGMKGEYDAAEANGDTETMKALIAKRDAYKRAVNAQNWEDKRDGMVYSMRQQAAYGNGPTRGQAEAMARWKAEEKLGGTGSAKKAIGYQILAGLGSTGGAGAALAGPGGAQPQNGNALQQRAWAVEDRDARYRHEREMQEARAQSALGLQEKQNEGSLAVEQTRAGAQTGVAGIESGARKYAADKDLAARLGAAETSANAQTTVASLDAEARKYAANKDLSARLGAAETAANAQRDVAATQSQTSRDVANIEAQARAQQSEIAAQAQRDVANINKNASVEVAKLDGETKRQVAEMNALTETIKQNGTAGKTEKQLDSQKRFMELTNMAQKLANGGMEAQDLVVAEAFIDRLDISDEQKAQKKTELRQGNFAWMVPYIMQQAKDAALAAGYPVPGSEAEAAATAQPAPAPTTPQPTQPAKPKPITKDYSR